MIFSSFRRTFLFALAFGLSTVCSNGLSAAEGFFARYYSNTNLSGTPTLTRIDPTINFNWGSQSPATGVPADNFSVRWVGYLTPPSSGLWTFTTVSDDGISLVVNGQTVVCDGTAHPEKEQSGVIELQAGVPVLVDLTYYEAGGQAVAQLSWSGPNVPKQVIPSTAVQTAESPLLFSSVPTMSETSPAFIEARTLSGGTVTLTANGAQASMISNGVHFFTNVPLNTVTSVETSLSVGVQVINRAITWQPIRLEGDKSRIIRVGDSLLLQAASAGAWRSIRGSGVGTPEKACKAGDRFPVSFTQPGVYEFVAFNAAGTQVGSLVVNAMSTDFGANIACEVGFRREKEIKVLGGDFAFLSFTSADPLLIDITPKGPSTEGGEIYLQPYRRGTPVIYARIGGPTGAILASKEIDEFTLANTARPGGLVNDETSLTSATLTITPFIPDLWINFSMFAHLSTFKGGAKKFTINTSQALSSLGEAGFTISTDASGEAIGQFKYTLEVPPGETKSCLQAIPQQINSPPKDVGFSTGYNGCWCRVSVEHIELKEGEAKPLDITVVQACPDGSRYDTSTTSGATADSPPPAHGKVDCKIPGPVSGINVDCSTFKVYGHTVVKGSYPGKYTLSIGDAYWEDLIWVYPGCTPQRDFPPKGKMTALAGDAYAWSPNMSTAFIPPGGKQSFRALDLDDSDMCDSNIVHDTFKKNGAVTWTSSGPGTVTFPDQISLQIDYAAPATAANTFIRMLIKDDGVYFQDLESPQFRDFRRLSVYKLTGVKVTGGDSVNPAAKEVVFRAGYSVQVAPIEISDGGRPDLEYSMLDEAGNPAVAPVVSNQSYWSFTIPKEGRYKFQIKNVNRPIETVLSDTYLYFTLSFEPPSVTFDWDPPAYTDASLRELSAKSASILDDIRDYNAKIQLGNNAKDAVVGYYDSLKAKIDAEIATLSQNVTQAESVQRRVQAQFDAIDAVVAQDTIRIENALRSRDLNLARAREALARGDVGRAAILNLAASAWDEVAGAWTMFRNISITQRTRIAIQLADAILQVQRIKDLVASVMSVKTLIAEAAMTNKLFQPMSAAMRAIIDSKVVGWGGRVVGVVGILFDIENIGRSGVNIDDAIQARSRQEALLKEYKQILDSLENGERPQAPLTKQLVVVSKPGSLDFTLSGSVAWRTHDSNGFIDANWPHLTKANGSLSNLDNTTWTTSTDGRFVFALEAYGNLGSETAQISRRGMSSANTAEITSAGSSEEQLINRLKPVFDAENATMKIAQNLFELANSTFQIIATALVLFIGVATGTATVLAIIAAIGATISLVWSSISQKGTALEEAIKRNYPR
jgi:PA14 domain